MKQVVYSEDSYSEIRVEVRDGFLHLRRVVAHLMAGPPYYCRQTRTGRMRVDWSDTYTDPEWGGSVPVHVVRGAIGG